MKLFFYFNLMVTTARFRTEKKKLSSNLPIKSCISGIGIMSQQSEPPVCGNLYSTNNYLVSLELKLFAAISECVFSFRSFVSQLGGVSTYTFWYFHFVGLNAPWKTPIVWATSFGFVWLLCKLGFPRSHFLDQRRFEYWPSSVWVTWRCPIQSKSSAKVASWLADNFQQDVFQRQQYNSEVLHLKCSFLIPQKITALCRVQDPRINPWVGLQVLMQLSTFHYCSLLAQQSQ